MKSWKRPPRWTWWVGGLVGIGFAIVPELRHAYEASLARDPERRATRIEETVLARNPPLVLVARREAALWAEAHGQLVALLRDNPDGISSAKIMEWQGPLSDRIKQGAARADDAAVVAVYGAKLALLKSLRTADPEACRAYIDLDIKALSALPEDLKVKINAADQALYTAYEAGVTRELPPMLTEAQADAELLRLQGTTGIRISNREMALITGSGPAAEVCDAMIRFMRLVVEAPTNDAAPVVRFMLLH